MAGWSQTQECRMAARDIGTHGDMCDTAIGGLPEDDREDDRIQEESIGRGDKVLFIEGIYSYRFIPWACKARHVYVNRKEAQRQNDK